MLLLTVGRSLTYPTGTPLRLSSKKHWGTGQACTPSRAPMAESLRKGKVEAANVPNVHGDGPAFPFLPRRASDQRQSSNVKERRRPVADRQAWHAKSYFGSSKANVPSGWKADIRSRGRTSSRLTPAPLLSLCLESEPNRCSRGQTAALARLRD